MSNKFNHLLMGKLRKVITVLTILDINYIIENQHIYITDIDYRNNKKELAEMGVM